MWPMIAPMRRFARLRLPRQVKFIHFAEFPVHIIAWKAHQSVALLIVQRGLKELGKASSSSAEAVSAEASSAMIWTCSTAGRASKRARISGERLARRLAISFFGNLRNQIRIARFPAMVKPLSRDAMLDLGWQFGQTAGRFAFPNRVAAGHSRGCGFHRWRGPWTWFR